MNGFLLIDKPAGPTSNDVLNQLKRSLGIKKMGHIGTLDPFATGLLVVGVGEALKYIPYLKEEPKVYEATLKLGVETDTLDLEGQVVAEKAVPALTFEIIRQAASKFIGAQKQIPPMYSAKKIAGQALYKLARAGEIIERKPCDITIHSLDILDFHDAQITFRVSSTRGTYIRVLGSDLAKALGTCGHLTALRRISIGDFFVSNAGTTPVDIADSLQHLPALTLEKDDAVKLLQGKVLPQSHPAGIYRAESEGRFLGLVEASGNSVKALRMMST